MSHPVDMCGRQRLLGLPSARLRFRHGPVRWKPTHTESTTNQRHIPLERWPMPIHHFLRPCYTTRRSEEHTSELKSLMRYSYAVLCLKKKYFKNITSP